MALKPDPETVAKTAEKFRGMERRDRIVYLSGAFEAVIKMAAEDHNECPKKDCGTCANLRFGLEWADAYEQTLRPKGGAR